MPYETFWHLTPKKLQTFTEAYKLRQKMRDEEMWLQGRYIHDAFLVGLSHFGASFGKKKSDAKYPEQPYMEMAKIQKEEQEKQTSEEEKQRMIENYMLRLQIMGSNFERANKKKK